MRSFCCSLPLQAFILWSASSCSAFAESPKKDEETPGTSARLSLASLFKLTVETAGRQQQLMTDAPSIVSTYSREDIERMGSQSVIDVLKYIPGIEVSMGIDGSWRVSIRGVRKDGNLLFLINGQATNDFYDGRALFDLPTAFIEKIEVVRGSGSPLFGTNAIGGIINVFTTNERKYAQITLGSYNTAQVDGGYVGTAGAWNYAIQAGYQQSDGSRIDPYSLDQSERLNQGRTQRWLKDAYLNAQFSREAFQASVWALKRNQGPWVGPRYILTEQSDYETDSLRVDASYQFELSPNLSLMPRVYVSYNLRDFYIEELPKSYQSSNSSVFVDGALTKENYLGLILGSETQIRYRPSEPLSILAGVIGERLDLQDYELSRNFRAGESPIYVGEFGNWDEVVLAQKGRRRTVSGFYNENTYTSELFTVSLGFRADHYSDFGQSLNPHSAFVYKPREELAFKVLYGQTFRAPTFKELYDQTDTSNFGTLGNQQLDSEVSQTQEIAAELKLSRLLLKANAYLNTTNNLIEAYDPQGTGGPAYFQNVGILKNRGFELEGNALLSDGITLFAHFAQFTMEFEWNSDVATLADQVYIKTRGDQYVTNQPARRVNLGLQGSYGNFQSFIGLNYGGTSEANRRSALEGQRNTKIPSYMQGDVNLGYRINEALKIQLAAHNIGSRKYSDPDSGVNINKMGDRGMVQPGAHYLLTSRYEF